MHTEPETLLNLAKAGYGPALGRLLARHRDSLAEQASSQLSRRLRVKLDVDDLLQEVWPEAYRDIRQFRSSSEAEFLAWLRQILNTVTLNQVRRYFGTRRRDLRRERRMEVDPDASSRIREQSLIAPHTSPTQQYAALICGDITSPGSRGLIRDCHGLGKPWVHVQAGLTTPRHIAGFIREIQVSRRMIAGDRESRDPGIGEGDERSLTVIFKAPRTAALPTA